MKHLFIHSFALALLLSVAACDKDKDNDTSKTKGKPSPSKVTKAPGVDEAFAKTEQGKTWLAWKESACQCKDLACVSKSADQRMGIERKYNPGRGPTAKAAGIIRMANVCLRKIIEASKK